MGRIKKRGLLLKLILYFAVALIIAQFGYLKLDKYLKQCMGACYSPNASSVIEANGIRFPFFWNSPDGDKNAVLVRPERFHKLVELTHIMPIVFFGTAILLAAVLFYYLNMRKPLKQLKMGIEKISAQDLEFEINYHGNDELGKLCEVFESMRENLRATFCDYWNSEEQQANLYSSIAHDLRTPLTILKGNNDVLRFLIETDPDSTKMMDTIDISDDAILRMERYTDALKQMKALETWDKEIEDVNISDLAGKLQIEGQQLALSEKKVFKVESLSFGVYRLDQTLIQLVIDRLIENAIRFAKKEILLRIQIRNVEKEKAEKHRKEIRSQEYLRVEVMDDGDGFSDMALKKAVTLFFTTDSSRKHSGIGLAAANSLLKNYDSCIHLENKFQGGAVVWFEIGLLD